MVESVLDGLVSSKFHMFSQLIGIHVFIEIFVNLQIVMELTDNGLVSVFLIKLAGIFTAQIVFHLRILCVVVAVAAGTG